MTRKVIQSALFGFAGIAMILVSGCFSYHRNETETPAQVAPSEPPGASTTTSTTQSNNGATQERSTTTYYNR
jgi:hypothetical protein